ncbi:MAG: glycosyltransferase family 9 protein [Candidatus Micrarchaeaceae archaeon]
MKSESVRRIARGLFHLTSFVIQIKYSKSKKLNLYNNIGSIIVFRPDNLGDFVLSIPAIISIKKFFPKSKITCVVNPDSSTLANKVCDKVINYTSPFVHSKGLVNSINYKYILNVLKEIKETKYDLILDLRSDILTLLFAIFDRNCKFRIDSSSKRIIPVFYKTVNMLLRKQIFEIKKVHEMDFICELLKNSTNIIADCKVDLSETLSQEDISNSLELIPQKMLNKPFAILHPGASWEYRMWSTEKYSKIANLLIEKYNLAIIIVGTKNEMNIANSLYSLIKEKENVINLCGKTSVLDIISLSKLSAVVICNDSAIGHIAAMSGANTISLFGAQDPEVFGPRGENVYIVRKKIECSPCAQIHCVKPEGKRCMDLISVDDVMDVFKQIKKDGKLI